MRIKKKSNNNNKLKYLKQNKKLNILKKLKREK